LTAIGIAGGLAGLKVDWALATASSAVRRPMKNTWEENFMAKELGVTGRRPRTGIYIREKGKALLFIPVEKGNWNKFFKQASPALVRSNWTYILLQILQ
jgi:hypothetical protein